jgi:hypothetical protein
MSPSVTASERELDSLVRRSNPLNETQGDDVSSVLAVLLLVSDGREG